VSAAARADCARAVEERHGGKATYVGSSRSRETRRGEPADETLIYVFDLTGNSAIDRIYIRLDPFDDFDVDAAVVRYRSPLVRRV
jgi:hypothetical protein